MKTAIMATGGTDSTLLMYELAEKNPIIISINYGQIIWEKQRELILYHMKKTKCVDPLVEISMQLFEWQKTPGLFIKNWYPEDKDPLKNWEELPHKSYFIEGRNAIMLCYALAYCAAYKIEELIVGYEYEKEEWKNIRTTKLIADDTSPHFLDTMNILALSGFSNVTRIRAPFYERRMDKKDIIRECLSRNLDLNKMYSCYFFPGPCGKCDNCLLRNKAIKDLAKEKNN